jgi:hypothetical protein
MCVNESDICIHLLIEKLTYKKPCQVHQNLKYRIFFPRTHSYTKQLPAAAHWRSSQLPQKRFAWLPAISALTLTNTSAAHIKNYRVIGSLSCRHILISASARTVRQVQIERRPGRASFRSLRSFCDFPL